MHLPDQMNSPISRIDMTRERPPTAKNANEALLISVEMLLENNASMTCTVALSSLQT